MRSTESQVARALASPGPRSEPSQTAGSGTLAPGQALANDVVATTIAADPNVPTTDLNGVDAYIIRLVEYAQSIVPGSKQCPSCKVPDASIDVLGI